MEPWKIPDDLYNITVWPLPEDLLDMKSWDADYIRRIARFVLKTMPRKDGRHSTQHRDVQFATRLAAYWQKTERKKATVTIASATKKESAFVIFAVDKFQRAGRFVSPSALEDVLRQGCKLTHNTETRAI
jgi:cytochrome c